MKHQCGLCIFGTFVGCILLIHVVTAVTEMPVMFSNTANMTASTTTEDTTSGLPEQITEIQSPETTDTVSATGRSSSVTTTKPLPSTTTSVSQRSNVSATSANPSQTTSTLPIDGAEYTDFTTDANPSQTTSTLPIDGAEFTDFTTDANPSQTDFTTDANPSQTDFTTVVNPSQTDFTTDVNPSQTDFTTDANPSQTNFTTDANPSQTDFTTDANPSQTTSTLPIDGAEYTDFTTDASPSQTDFTTDANPSQTDFTTDANPSQTTSTLPIDGAEYTDFTTDANPSQTDFTTDANPSQTDFTTVVNPSQTDFTTDVNPSQTDFTTDANPSQTDFTTDANPSQTDFTTDANPSQTTSTLPIDGAEYPEFTTDANPSQTDFTTDANPSQTTSTLPVDGAEYTDFTTDTDLMHTTITEPTDIPKPTKKPEPSCGTLSHPLNGEVIFQNRSTSGRVATYSCDNGYLLVGDLERRCLATGTWDGLPPVCYKKETKIVVCSDDVDWKGRFWAEVLAGQTRRKDCPEHFSGNITRYCQEDGRWSLPRYNCVRDSIKTVKRNVDALGPNVTERDVKEVLGEITNVTKQEENVTQDDILTDGELDVLVDSLEKVVETVLDIPGDILDEEITDDVIETTSNLIDKTNQESWRSLKETESNSGEKVLSTVDSIGGALCPTLERSVTDKLSVVKKNLAFEVQKVSNDDMMFPNPDIEDTAATEDQAWLKQTKSKIQLDPVSIKSDPCSVTAVMYRDLSDILPVKTRAPSTSTNEVTESKERINAPILAMSITPPISGKLDPPVRITFEHADKSLTDPVCTFWQFQNDSQGYWSTEGCKVIFTNENFTRCECDHLTNFAVLMSPFRQADATSQALRIISIIGISVSILCLLMTFGVHFVLWRHVRNDRTTRLMNLCTALLLSYVIFLAGVDRTESTIACTAIAAVLQYIYLVVFAIMLVEGIEITVSVLYVFKTRSRTKLFLIFAWVLPGVIVGISLGVTRANGYGDSNFCWLSVDNGVIWAFVAPALVIIFFNVICIFLVIRAMFQSTAVKNKNAADKIKTSLRSLCVLVPVMGVSWLLGIFYVNDSFHFIQYIFAIFNGLQGFFIFLIHCLLNKQVRNAYSHRARKKSAAYFSSNNTSKDERNNKTKEKVISSDDREYESSGDRKSKILQETFTKSQSGEGTFNGISNKGSLRRSAAFNTESFEKLVYNSFDV